MRIVENIKTVEENYRQLNDLINPHLESLDNDKVKDKQKIIEICHAGKFLMLLDDEIQIDKLFESPDFILNSISGKIGLEHQILVDSKPKEKEGFFENIFSAAESDLQADVELPNFLANCYLKHDVNFKLSQKNSFISTIKSVVKEYVLTGNLIDNLLIDKIHKMPHSHKSINVNLGAWWVKDVTPELMVNAIKKKEKKLDAYRENCGNAQWLLIVIGSNGESSFNMNKDFELNFTSDFDKVYVLEDFYNKLYELK